MTVQRESRWLPETWTSDIWARAAGRTLPGVDNDGRHMTSAATGHHADYVGEDRWVVDWLPGRTFTAQAAKAAMLIASAPTWPEVSRWATKLGLTVNEARQFVAEEAVR